MKMVIYKIQSKIKPERFYIGSAIDYERRKGEHLRELRRNDHHSKFLQKHYNKYGVEDLSFSVMENVSESKNLLIVEQKYIDTLKPAFNASVTAGSTLGYKHTKEAKEKMSKARTGVKKMPMTIEQKEKLRQAHLGKKCTAETKKKMSLSNPKHMLGKKHKPESLEKMRIAKIGKTTSDETKAKMSLAHKGKPKLSRARKVIDTKTNKIYESIKSAAILNSINVSTLNAIFQGRLKNNTSLILLI